MAMLNLDVFNISSLQSFKQLLVVMDSSGVGISDAISIIDSKIAKVNSLRHNNVARDAAQIHAHVNPTGSDQVAADIPACKSCGDGKLVGPFIIDGVEIYRCSLKCGYSEVR